MRAISLKLKQFLRRPCFLCHELGPFSVAALKDHVILSNKQASVATNCFSRCHVVFSSKRLHFMRFFQRKLEAHGKVPIIGSVEEK